MISTLLVDYAGVLTPTKDNWIFAHQYHQHYSLSPEQLIDISYTDWELAATNKISSQDYWKNIGNLLQTDPKVVRAQIIASYPLDTDVIDYLKQVRTKFKLIMVSNQIEDWLEEVIEKNHLRDIFHYTANSYEVGVRKPDRKIFEYALKLADCEPSQVVLIDDQSKNIDAARDLGIITVQFSDLSSLKQIEL